MSSALAKKLGIKDGFRIRTIHAPAFFAEVVRPAGESPFDYIHLFTNRLTELERLLPECKRDLAKTGMLWISWYKKSSGKPSELGDNVVREAGLGIGLVDVKVCAVDEDWSGLKFVFRLKDR